MESTDISILEADQERDIINDLLGISLELTDKTISPKKKADKKGWRGKKTPHEYYLKNKERYQQRYKEHKVEISKRGKELYYKITPFQKFEMVEYNRMRRHINRHGNLDGFIPKTYQKTE